MAQVKPLSGEFPGCFQKLLGRKGLDFAEGQASPGVVAGSSSARGKNNILQLLGQRVNWMAHQKGLTSGNSESIADLQRKANNTASGKRIKFDSIWPMLGPKSPPIFLLPLGNIRKVMLQPKLLFLFPT